MKRNESNRIHLSSVLDHLTSTPMSPDLLSHKITIFIASLIIFWTGRSRPKNKKEREKRVANDTILHLYSFLLLLIVNDLKDFQIDFLNLCHNSDLFLPAHAAQQEDEGEHAHFHGFDPKSRLLSTTIEADRQVYIEL